MASERFVTLVSFFLAYVVVSSGVDSPSSIPDGSSTDLVSAVSHESGSLTVQEAISSDPVNLDPSPSLEIHGCSLDNGGSSSYSHSDSSAVENPIINTQTVSEIAEHLSATALEDSKGGDQQPQEGVREKEEIVSLTPVSGKKNLSTFSEWVETRKREEQVKVKNSNNGNTSVPSLNPQGGNEKNNGSLASNGSLPLPPPSMARKSKRNFASPDCGAKVVAANSEAQGSSLLLSSSRDEYLLTPCRTEKRIFAVVELCEAIRPERIDLANFELFSSSPKEFTISVSAKYPTRDWVLLGNGSAASFLSDDHHGVQEFLLLSAPLEGGAGEDGGRPSMFVKFIKLEVLSHYGTEHYCPLSLFRVYGTSEYEAMAEEEQYDQVQSGADLSSHASSLRDDDESLISDDGDDEMVGESKKGASQGIFLSAKDTVIKIVKQAAEAWSRPKEEELPAAPALPAIRECMSSRHGNLTSFAWRLLSCGWPSSKALTCSQDYNPRFPYRICSENPSEGISLCPHGLGSLFLASIINTSQFESLRLLHLLCPLERKGLPDLQVAELSPPPPRPKPSKPSRKPASKTKPKRPRARDAEQVRNATLEKGGEFPTEDTPSSLAEAESFGTGKPKGSSLPLEPKSKAGSIAESISGNSIISGPPIPPNPPPGSKETALLRLSNRVRALELNLTLANGYLEELSQSYKGQVEELQLALARTQASLGELLKAYRELQLKVEDMQTRFDGQFSESLIFAPGFQWCVLGLIALLIVCTWVCRKTRSSVALSKEEVDEQVSTANGKAKRKKKKQKTKVLPNGIVRSFSSREFASPLEDIQEIPGARKAQSIESLNWIGTHVQDLRLQDSGRHVHNGDISRASLAGQCKTKSLGNSSIIKTGNKK